MRLWRHLCFADESIVEVAVSQERLETLTDDLKV